VRGLAKLDRKLAMDGIRSGAINIMIASDLAARGLNILADAPVRRACGSGMYGSGPLLGPRRE